MIFLRGRQPADLVSFWNGSAADGIDVIGPVRLPSNPRRDAIRLCQEQWANNHPANARSWSGWVGAEVEGVALEDGRPTRTFFYV